MDPTTYTKHMTGDTSNLGAAANVPFLGNAQPLGISHNNTTPTPFLQRGGAMMTVSGLLILGGLFAQTQGRGTVQKALLYPGLMVMGYGVARLT